MNDEIEETRRRPFEAPASGRTLSACAEEGLEDRITAGEILHKNGQEKAQRALK
jgi:hypothetical protein